MTADKAYTGSTFSLYGRVFRNHRYRTGILLGYTHMRGLKRKPNDATEDKGDREMGGGDGGDGGDVS